MLKTCAQCVDYLSKVIRIKSAILSTSNVQNAIERTAYRVQDSFSTHSFPQIIALLSPAKMTLLPLIEHTFYPVSTAPTTNCSQNKFEER